MLESKVQRDVRLHLGQKPDLVVWRNNTGTWQDSKGNWVRYGLCPGSSDLIGILTYKGSFEDLGRFFAAEIKGTHGQLEKEQQRFIDLVNKMGGYGCVIRSVDEAEAHYQRARQGLGPPG